MTGLLILWATHAINAQPSAASSQILIIHSYHSGLSWTDSIMSGIRDTFARSGHDIQISAEYLDARRYVDAGHARLIRELVISKLKGTTPDLVMVSDNAALEFMLEQRDRLFPETPIVFCGINDFQPSMIAKYRGITGVAEDVSVVETVSLALRLQPGTREIIVIGRTNVAADRYNRDSFLAALPMLPGQLKVTFWDDLPVVELRTRLEKLERGMIVFLNGLIMDETGRQLMYGETTRLITHHSPVPVYSLWDDYLGQGIVGGKLVGGYRQGQLAADLALRILKGENADHLPVVNPVAANHYMVDYQQLKRFDLPLSSLPPNTQIINRPESLYDQHKDIVLATAIVIVALSAFVVFLTITIMTRRKMEYALQQANRVVENSPVVLFRWKADESWPVEFVSRNVGQFGYSQEELLHGDVPFASLIHPQDLDRAASEVQQYAASGADKFEREYRIVTRDGNVRWVADHTVIERNNAGRMTHYQGIVTDITERKLAEQALLASEKKYRELVESANSVIIRWKPDGEITYFNRYGLSFFRYREEEVLGRNVMILIPGQDSTGHDLSDLAHAIVEHPEQYINNENENVLSDGRRVWVQWTNKAILDEAGNIREILAIGNDITERKQAEEDLKQSEERFRMVVENAPDAIYIRSVSGHFIYLNTAAVRLFGATSSDPLIGMHIMERIHPDESAPITERIKRLTEGQAVPMIEQMLLRMDGSPISVEVMAVPLRYEGTNVVLVFARDITDRKQMETGRRSLEERLQRSEKMEALGLMAGGVAHDLNNVLGILVGYSELLAEDIDEKSPLRPHVDYIRQGGERAAAIVQDLLTMARRGVQTLEIVNLSSLLDDFRDSPEFEKICSSHPNVKVDTVYANGLLNIMGSPVHLRKTVMNLVSNAAEAMPAGGLLTLTTNNVYLDRPVPGYDDIREGDYVVLSVTDTGEGISDSDMKRIFEPFYTKKVMGRSGTGLGLAVVWGTVKDHNGYINVQSEEGKGTTFSLYFPVTREEAAREGETVPVAEYRGKGESILVVDDVQGQRELAVQMLKRLNYQATSVASGEQAVEYVKRNKADLLVLDMIMDPGMDGLDTYKEIVKLHPKQRAIIVSGFSESDRVRQAQALGAGAYVRKPYVSESLGIAVRNELKRSA